MAKEILGDVTSVVDVREVSRFEVWETSAFILNKSRANNSDGVSRRASVSALHGWMYFTVFGR
jgi:hypothetical protein